MLIENEMQDSVKKCTPMELLELIKNNKNLLQSMQTEELISLCHKMNFNGQIIKDGERKPVLFSAVNMKEDYIKKLKMVSLVKFLDRLINFEFEDIAKKIGLPSESHKEAQSYVKQFFDHVLKYNPKHCARSSYQEKVVADVSRDDVTEEQKLDMPSLDVFERWQRYEESNSTEIKKYVRDFYSARPGYDFAIQVYGTFDTDEQAERFKDEHATTIALDMYQGLTNRWILLETSEECLDRVKYCGSKDNEIIENMIQQWNKDAEIGHEMMKMRMESAVDENRKETGYVDKEELKKRINQIGIEETKEEREMREEIRRRKSELFGITGPQFGDSNDHSGPI